MNILISIGHPAHVHIFKNFIYEMKRRGHKVLICATDKEVSLKLLDAYKIDYIPVNKFQGNIIAKVGSLIKADFKVWQITRKFAPDIFGGVGAITASHISGLFRKPSIIFEDTEDSIEQFLLYYPFAKIICTPSSFKKNLGKKQFRYDSFQEIAYLHPKYFKPDPSALDDLGIGMQERFAFARFVSWNASHDFTKHGFTNKLELVKKISNYCKVFVSSEEKLDGELEEYGISIAPEKLHSVLHYASLCISDAGTTAIESALLGTPTVRLACWTLKPKNWNITQVFGVFDELANKYGLMHIFSDENLAVEKALELIKDIDSKNKVKKLAERVFVEKIDLTEFMVNLFEKVGKAEKNNL